MYYMAHVCFYVCCVAAVVEDSVLRLEVLMYVVCLCKGCDRCCVSCLYRHEITILEYSVDWTSYATLNTSSMLVGVMALEKVWPTICGILCIVIVLP